MIPTDLNIYPILISAIGLTYSGRDTCMSFLAEELWEDGYKNLVVLNLSQNLPEQFIKLSKTWHYNRTTPKKQLPILLINRVEYEADYNTIKGYPNLILFHVQRNPYKEGSYIHRDIKEHVEIAPAWIVNAPAIPIRNDDSLRLFRFQVKDALKYFVKTHTTWKKVYQ